MSDTPETDKAIAENWPMQYGYPGWDGNPPLADFARRLERERDEARAALGIWKNMFENLKKDLDKSKQ